MSRKSDDRGLNRKFIQIWRFNRQKSTFRGFFLSSDTLLTSFCYFNFGFISKLLLRRGIFLDSWSSDFSSFKLFTLKTFANCAAERERFLEINVYAEFKRKAESKNLHEEIVATTAIRIVATGIHDNFRKQDSLNFKSADSSWRRSLKLDFIPENCEILGIRLNHVITSFVRKCDINFILDFGESSSGQAIKIFWTGLVWN